MMRIVFRMSFRYLNLLSNEIFAIWSTAVLNGTNQAAMLTVPSSLQSLAARYRGHLQLNPYQ